MIPRTDATRVCRRVYPLRPSIVLAATLAVCAGDPGVLVPQHNNQTRLFNWLDSSAKAQTSKPSDGLPDFTDIVDKVKPAVVGISARAEEQTTGQGPSRSPEPQADPFEHFFNAPKGSPGARPRARRSTAQGSGFFITADGFAVTTNHVVEHATSIEITTDDNKTYAARLVGADPQTDLALLKVETDREFVSVRLAEKMPRIGDWVLTIGNPFGLGGTVTAGIVSASARNIATSSLNDFIQIDASVNQGSSGGPTFDLGGNVIGVNSAIFSPNGVSAGIGFAIPADTVKLVIAQLMDKGTVSHGWIGIKILPVTNEVGQGFGIKRAQGALVVEVQPNSPAAKALTQGDIVTSINSEPVKDDRELTKKIGNLAVGTSIELGVIRNGEETTVTVTLGELPRSRNEVP